MIQSVMLVALGFLAASVLALVFAPALWHRAVRLTTKRIRSSLPMTMNEIQADKDRLRADFAIRIRKFEVALEREKMKSAHQLVDISRRESEIKALENKIDAMQRDLEEQQNANRVYAQTISLRIPNMESQLSKAKELLGARYEEISKLRTTINRQENKLGEAKTLDQMRKAELNRLRSALGSAPHGSEGDGIEPMSDLEQALARNRDLEKEIVTLRQQLNGASRSGANDNILSESESEKRKSSIAETEVGQVVKRILSGFSIASVSADNDARSQEEKASDDADALEEKADSSASVFYQPEVSAERDATEQLAKETSEEVASNGLAENQGVSAEAEAEEQPSLVEEESTDTAEEPEVATSEIAAEDVSSEAGSNEVEETNAAEEAKLDEGAAVVTFDNSKDETAEASNSDDTAEAGTAEDEASSTQTDDVEIRETDVVSEASDNTDQKDTGEDEDAPRDEDASDAKEKTGEGFLRATKRSLSERLKGL